MKCILHIGTEKTGTTLLQNWLYSNRDELSGQGVFLSDVLGKTNNRKLVAYFQDNFDDYSQEKLIFTQDDKDRFFQGFEAAFEAENCMACTEHHTMVISSEHFHSRLQKLELITQLRTFLARYFDEVRVVCYFREQSDMHQSLYSTVVKLSSCDKIDEFQQGITEDTYYYNFYEIAKRWSSVFGRENCEFRVYDRSRFKDRDLRKDFLDCFFEPIEFEKLDYDYTPSNESISLLEGELYRIVNKSIPFWKSDNLGVNPLNHEIKETISKCETLKVGQLKNARKSSIRSEFIQSNNSFFNEFFDGEYLFPQELEQETISQEITFSMGELQSILGEFLEQIIDDHLSRVLTNKDADTLRA